MKHLFDIYSMILCGGNDIFITLLSPTIKATLNAALDALASSNQWVREPTIPEW